MLVVIPDTGARARAGEAAVSAKSGGGGRGGNDQGQGYGGIKETYQNRRLSPAVFFGLKIPQSVFSDSVARRDAQVRTESSEVAWTYATA